MDVKDGGDHQEYIRETRRDTCRLPPVPVIYARQGIPGHCAAELGEGDQWATQGVTSQHQESIFWAYANILWGEQ